MTEKLLLFGGAIQMAGTIKSRKSDRHAKSDWMAMEQERGISVVSKGTDNHIVLLDLRSIKMTGKKADALISEVNITANKNTVPFDPESPFVTSGLRLGSAALTTRGFNEEAFVEIADVISDCLLNPEDSIVKKKCKEKVLNLCKLFPLYS